MNASSTLSRVQVISALYDGAVGLLLALPWAGALMSYVHEVTRAAGHFSEFSGLHLLILNLFGGFTIAWSVVRIRLNTPALSLADALLRLYFAAVMIAYLLTTSISAIVWVFVVTELGWGGLQLVLYGMARGKSGSSGR